MARHAARMTTMTTCPTCSHDLAVSATTCPHCGAKHKTSFGEQTLSVVMVVVGLVVALALVGFVVNQIAG